ncbi:MAG: hypothetical protein R3F31_22460 [Verrucomicrobiales bacterium]
MSFRYRHPALRAARLVLKNTLGACSSWSGSPCWCSRVRGILTI